MTRCLKCWRDDKVIGKLIEIVISAMGTYKLFEILAKCLESIIDNIDKHD